MNYIICKEHSKSQFIKLGYNNFCNLADMDLDDKIAIDTETTGLKARHEKMFCCQIGNGRGSNYIIVLYNRNYSFSDVVPFIKGKTLVGHNILFDLGFMYLEGFFPSDVRDTMLATKILYNGYTDRHNIPYRADFGAVMERELNIHYDKTDQKNIHIVKLSQRSTIEYSFNDVDRLLELESFLGKKLKERGSLGTYRLHCRYIKALAYMEQCGLPVSSKKWKDKMNVDLDNQFKYKKIVEEYIYDTLPQYADKQLDMFADDLKNILVSVTSAKQMVPVFNALGIETKDKDGKESTEENIIKKSKHEFVPLWLDFQHANHRVTTFGDKIYQQIENERVYTNFNPMVDTARLSSRKGSINFLNFPADSSTREAFECKPENKMIVCDWSGQETVIAADLSGDEAMTHSVNTGACLHCAFARILFPELAELDDETITKEHKSKRQAAKSPRFAFQYGGSAYTIHQNEGIPLDEANKIETAFKELHWGLYIWGAKELDKALRQGYIESADGWKLKLPKFDRYKELEKNIRSISREGWLLYRIGKAEFKKKEEDKEHVVENKEALGFYKANKSEVSYFFRLKSEYARLCLNNPVQSRGSHQLKLASCLFFEWIIANNLQWIILLVNTIHDEIVAESPEHLAEKTRLKVQECMLIGGDHYLTNLKIKADAAIGNSWGEAK